LDCYEQFGGKTCRPKTLAPRERGFATDREGFQVIVPKGQKAARQRRQTEAKLREV
jgi:hypothetical protein